MISIVQETQSGGAVKLIAGTDWDRSISKDAGEAGKGSVSNSVFVLVYSANLLLKSLICKFA